MWEVWKAQFCSLIPVHILIILRIWIQVSYSSCGETGQKMVNYLSLVLPLGVESIFNVYEGLILFLKSECIRLWCWFLIIKHRSLGLSGDEGIIFILAFWRSGRSKPQRVPSLEGHLKQPNLT